MSHRVRVAVIGASGYTGADLIRLALRHPDIEIAALTANAHAGKAIDQVYPHLTGYDLPPLVTNDEVDWQSIDVAFCGLPHATSAIVIKDLPESVRVIDMSADFRLRDTATYEQWYGEHPAPELQQQAVYGLSEHYREHIASARIVACPGCYPTAVLNLLLPVVSKGLIDAENLIIDAKSGTTGAGRSPKQLTLLAEAGEGMGPYAVASHRHAPEIEQEISRAAGSDVLVTFTPHLIPMSRGELITAYARLAPGVTVEDCQTALLQRYENEEFIGPPPAGSFPQTQFVRGSNRIMLGAYADRAPGRVILVAALDNLVKGSAGQALQNFNIMCGLPEARGLQQIAMFP